MSWRKEKNGNLFREWVVKHQIGPGMNDINLRKVKDGLYSGFDGSVAEGWIPIIDRLATDLIALGWDRDLHQVKEKFGGLRFYIGASSQEMEERISMAEDESYKTCENCGDFGEKSAVGYWLLTLCKTCHDARAAEYKEKYGDTKP